MAPHVITLQEAESARETWGANCGPGALAGVLGLPLAVVRPHLKDFDRKRYTNPTMMREALESLDINFTWQVTRRQCHTFPNFGLARVQWSGPWTKPGVPAAAAYRHTHWIGSRQRPVEPFGSQLEIFDINCMCVGGWVPFAEWGGSVVPWLLKECVPKADGTWWLTHVVELVEGRQ